jgi:hypothetical protein
LESRQIRKGDAGVITRVTVPNPFSPKHEFNSDGGAAPRGRPTFDSVLRFNFTYGEIRKNCAALVDGNVAGLELVTGLHAAGLSDSVVCKSFDGNDDAMVPGAIPGYGTAPRLMLSSELVQATVT